MTNKTIKIILLFIAGAALVYGGVQLYRQLHSFRTKAEAVAYLISVDPSKDVSLLMDFGDEYIIAWANSLYKKESKFHAGGGIYDSKNGRKIGDYVQGKDFFSFG